MTKTKRTRKNSLRAKIEEHLQANRRWPLPPDVVDAIENQINEASDGIINSLIDKHSSAESVGRILKDQAAQPPSPGDATTSGEPSAAKPTTPGKKAQGAHA